MFCWQELKTKNMYTLLGTVPHIPRWLLSGSSKVDCSEETWIKASTGFLFSLFLEMHTLSKQEIAPCFNKLQGSVTQFASVLLSREENHFLPSVTWVFIPIPYKLSPSLCVCVYGGVTIAQCLPCARHFFYILYTNSFNPTHLVR